MMARVMVEGIRDYIFEGLNVEFDHSLMTESGLFPNAACGMISGSLVALLSVQGHQTMSHLSLVL